MCLDRRIKTTDLDDEASYNYNRKVGWKYFIDPPFPPKFWFYAHNGHRTVPLNRWLTARQTIINYYNKTARGRYKSGFHVFLKSGCISRVAYPFVIEYAVQWDEPILVGIDEGSPCVIVKKLFVPCDAKTSEQLSDCSQLNGVQKSCTGIIHVLNHNVKTKG